MQCNEEEERACIYDFIQATTMMMMMTYCVGEVNERLIFYLRSSLEMHACIHISTYRREILEGGRKALFYGVECMLCAVWHKERKRHIIHNNMQAF